MKKYLFSLAIICFSFVGCEKTECQTCGIYTNAPGASQEKTYCGTADEIEAEEERIQNDCVVLQAAYPQYYFDCGCQ